MVATRSRGSESEEPAAASDDAFMEQLLQGMSSALGLAPRDEVEDAAGPSGSAAQALENAHLKWRPDLRLPVSGPQEPILATRGVDELTKQVWSVCKEWVLQPVQGMHRRLATSRGRGTASHINNG